MQLSVSSLTFAMLAVAPCDASLRVPKSRLLLDKLPDTGEQWQSLMNGNEFQPAKNLSPLAQEHLRRLVEEEDAANPLRGRTSTSTSTRRRGEEEAETYAPTTEEGSWYQTSKSKATIWYKQLEDKTSTWYQNMASSSSSSSSNFVTNSNGQKEEGFEKIFADGAETYYDENSQAWRALSTSNFDKQEGFEKIFADGAETYYDENSQAWRALSTSNFDKQEGFEKIFADGAETYYDENSQAWRALGFFIDCDYVDDEEQQNNEQNQQSGCRRFMLWAAVSIFKLYYYLYSCFANKDSSRPTFLLSQKVC
jgi:hypothetical protein